MMKRSSKQSFVCSTNEELKRRVEPLLDVIMFEEQKLPYMEMSKSIIT